MINTNLDAILQFVSVDVSRKCLWLTAPVAEAWMRGWIQTAGVEALRADPRSGSCRSRPMRAGEEDGDASALTSSQTKFSLCNSICVCCLLAKGGGI